MAHVPAHPTYTKMYRDWVKFKKVMAGGQEFIEAALKKYSALESDADLILRQNSAFSPSASKSAILEIRNAIFSRLHDVKRLGGTDSYKQAVKGLGPGVDGEGSSMSTVIGLEIVEDLLAFGKVGVYIDRESVTNIPDARSKWPYIYPYGALDIWNWNTDRKGVIKDLALIDDLEIKDGNFVTGVVKILRILHLNSAGDVEVTFERHPGVLIEGTPPTDDGELDLPLSATLTQLHRIPFHQFKIRQSLLADIADHQIALLNLASSDLGHAIRGNISFYTEQRDLANEQGSQYLRNPDENATDTPPIEEDAVARTGTTVGRIYGKDLDRPGFIGPPTDNLVASRAFSQDIKEEVRALIGLALTSIKPMRESAESKDKDSSGREAALLAIASTLQDGETEIAKIWALYERKDPDIEVKYPKTFKILSEEERLDLSKKMREEMDKIPSKTYQKEIAKKVANAMVEGETTDESLETIHKEIDDAVVVVTDPETIAQDIESGLVGVQMASEARGYPPGETENAKMDHSDKLIRIQKAQTPAPLIDDAGARGLKDLALDSDDAKNEKARLAEQDKGNNGKQAVVKE